MFQDEIKRRDFLKWTMVAGSAVAALSIAPKKVFASVSGKVTLDECMAMTPVEMAEKSYLIQDTWNGMKTAVKGIKDPTTRTLVEGILQNPAPTFMERYPDDASKAALKNELVKAGFLDESVSDSVFLLKETDPRKSPQPFYSAPGSGYESHHAYPGGLVTHTGLNVKVSIALYEAYADIYGYTLDKSVVIAAQTLHDLIKPWVFQWNEDGSSRTEISLAGTGEHHCCSAAESMYRGLSPEVVVAQISAHERPGDEKLEQTVVGWIKAAAILAGKDPVKEGYLSKSGDTLPIPRDQEYFVTHLGDHDWVLTVPAAKWIIPLAEEIALQEYGMTEADLKTKKFHAFRNYVFSQASIMTLYQVLNMQGKEGLTQTLKEMVAV